MSSGLWFVLGEVVGVAFWLAGEVWGESLSRKRPANKIRQTAQELLEATKRQGYTENADVYLAAAKLENALEDDQ